MTEITAGGSGGAGPGGLLIPGAHRGAWALLSSRYANAGTGRAGTMETMSSRRPAGYDPTDYPPFAVTVDLVLLTVRDGQLKTVLVRRDEEPYQGRWALPGGFVHPDENLDSAVTRVFRAKTGLDVPYVEQLGTYGDAGRDPRMRVVSVAYLVLLPLGADSDPGAEAGTARLFAVDNLPAADTEGRHLAFDHDRILADAVARAQAKLEYTTLAATLLPDTFTLGELRQVYEAVWGEELHPSNFARKVLSVGGFVQATGRSGTGPGVPQLYRRGDAAEMMPPLMRRSVRRSPRKATR